MLPSAFSKINAEHVIRQRTKKREKTEDKIICLFVYFLCVHMFIIVNVSTCWDFFLISSFFYMYIVLFLDPRPIHINV